MVGLNPEQHAAALRTLRRICGMLAHPNADKVFGCMGQDKVGKILDLQIMLAITCGLTSDEVSSLGQVAAPEIIVVEKSDGTFAFDLSDDRAQ